MDRALLASALMLSVAATGTAAEIRQTLPGARRSTPLSTIAFAGEELVLNIKVYEHILETEAKRNPIPLKLQV